MPPDAAHRALGQAWLALCLALALHVADEALSGFLAVYNPAVMAIREAVPWLPLPLFRFDLWLAGLIVGIAALSALSPLVFRGARWIRPPAWILGVLMTANALGHAVGSLLLGRPMPGLWSSPLLLAASLHLLYRLRSSRS